MGAVFGVWAFHIVVAIIALIEIGIIIAYDAPRIIVRIEIVIDLTIVMFVWFNNLGCDTLESFSRFNTLNENL